MTHDRPIRISAAGSRKAPHWPAQQLMWNAFIARLATPVRSVESFAEYMAYPKARQDELKDVGGFVGGTFNPERRKPAYLIGRDIITLDLDNIEAHGTEAVLARLEGLGVSYAVYSTRKHWEGAPRLRVIVCGDRTITPEEYQPVARKLAEIIGIQWCDPTTFEGNRLMYWPSCCADAHYVYRWADKPFLSVDGTLDMYTDWRDASQWPRVPGDAGPNLQREAAKQGDPHAKTGVVGAFCRVYSVEAAMDEYLPGVYDACEDGRYTFVGGSTTGGAVVYDNGKFLYSHHATDPCGGKLVNAFDLVRLHLYGMLDDEMLPGTPVASSPSYKAMRERAFQDAQVRALLDQERYAEVAQIFSPVTGVAVSAPGATEWRGMLKSDGKGRIERTHHNMLLMLENDPQLVGRIRRDQFADIVRGVAPLPWLPRSNEVGYFEWTDRDDAALRVYAEGQLDFNTQDAYFTAFQVAAESHAFNPVREFLRGVRWDGVPRLETLFIDYLGAEDCAYVRTVTRKALVAAVARAFEPGTKFDEMVVLVGDQGTFKSTIVAKLGGEWYSDNVITFDGRDAAENVQGVWIVEISELQALNRSEINTVKGFMSRQIDRYRAAYGRRTAAHPRQCVFFGTTNTREFLQDPTGGRRFWPVIVHVNTPHKHVIRDFTPLEVAQVWAEAVALYDLGEPLHLSPEIAAEAERRRAEHEVRDLLQGQIEEFLDKPIPAGWYDMTLEQHRRFHAGMMADAGTLMPRDRVCTVEIVRECIGEMRPEIDPRTSKRVSAILDRLPEWERIATMKFGATYGVQRGFRRREAINAR